MLSIMSNLLNECMNIFHGFVYSVGWARSILIRFNVGHSIVCLEAILV